MSAAADPDALPVRLLPHAGSGDRSPPRQLGMGTRPVGPGPVAHSADRHCGYHVLHAAPDAASCHGPGPAEDDEYHDAGDAGLYQLESGGWTLLVLVHGQPDRLGAASCHEPYRART